jgi:hypothetical protein
VNPALRWALPALVLAAGAAHAGAAGKVAAEVLERSAEAAARTSGRPLGSSTARKAAVEEAGRLSEKHGVAVLKTIEDSGLELLEEAPKYGDELVQIAMKASPQARRALATNVPELLPLAQKVGIEAIEVEAKAPGQASNLFRIFGPEEGRHLAQAARAEDLPRMIKYGEKADGEATRGLLVDAYRKEGAGLFRRIPPQLVLSGGLTSAMLHGTYRMTGPFQAIADVLREHPVLAAVGALSIVALIVVLVFWRFGFMPWHRRRNPAT